MKIVTEMLNVFHKGGIIMLTSLTKSMEVEKRENAVIKTALIAAVSIFAVANVYQICDLLGITLAPDWYRKIVDIVSNGGGVAAAFAAVAGITLPAWVLTATAGFMGASL